MNRQTQRGLLMKVNEIASLCRAIQQYANEERAEYDDMSDEKQESVSGMDYAERIDVLEEAAEDTLRTLENLKDAIDDPQWGD